MYFFYIPEKMCKIDKMHPEDLQLYNNISAESECHFKIDRNTALVLPIADLPGNKKKHQWQKDHIPNETGTDKSYDPEKSRIKNHKVKNNEYKKWKPN